MTQNMIETLYGYLLAGNYEQFFVQLFNYYFPFALPFWMIGIAIFGISHMKTKNMAFAAALTSVYLLLISGSGYVVNAYAQIIMRLAGLIIALIAGYYLYRSWRG